MKVIRNVILDWSGTLVDDFQPVLEATNEIFKQYGKPGMTEAEFRDKFFLPFPDFYKIYLPEATMVELEHHYHTSFKLLQENIQLLPYAREFLEYAKSQGMQLFILSTIHQDHWTVQSARLGIRDFFKKAYVQALDKRKTILHLLAEHDLDPGETLFVGDMMHDIETAKHGGVTSCGVLTGYDSLEKLKSVSPDLLFRHIGHVKNYLERHRQASTGLFPIATVGALILHRKTGRVLMVKTHKWQNKWGIPGGKIKPEETSEAALRREILEETGLSVDEIRFAMVQDCIRSPEFFKQAHFLLLNYVAWTEQEQVTLNDEAQEERWVTWDDLKSMDLNIPTKILVDYVEAHPELLSPSHPPQ